MKKWPISFISLFFLEAVMHYKLCTVKVYIHIYMCVYTLFYLVSKSTLSPCLYVISI